MVLMASELCNLGVARACVAAAGRLRGVRASRLEPAELMRCLGWSPPPLVALETLPEASRSAVGAVVKPTVVVFNSCPPVSTREAAFRDWPEVTLKQSGWADYVFKKQMLFDATRPLVLAAPASEDAAYLEHAATVEGVPFLCLGAGAVDRFAAYAGATVLEAPEPSAEDAAASAGVACDVVNLHGDFAQLVKPRAPSTRSVLAVAGGAATPDLVEALEALARATKGCFDVTST